MSDSSPSPPAAGSERRYSAAAVRFWVAPDTPDRDEIEERATRFLLDHPGVEPLEPGLCAVLPAPADPAVFDCAIAWSQELLKDLAAHHDPEAVDAGLRVLVHPTVVSGSSAGFERKPDWFETDLADRLPNLPEGCGLVVSSRASRMLESPIRFVRAGEYQGPSGRSVPLATVVGRRHDLPPWRNPEILGRRLKAVERPRPAGELEQLLAEPAACLVGSLGCGKTRLAWEALHRSGRKFLWLRAHPERRSRPSLGDQILHHLLSPTASQRADPSHPSTGSAADQQEIRAELASWRVEGAGREAETLAAMTNMILERLTPADSEPITIVFDELESLSEADHEFLTLTLGSPDLGKRFRALFVGRPEAWSSELPDLPSLRLERPEDRWVEELADTMVAGLSLPDAVRRRFVESTGGNPFAFEEGLLGLLHERSFRTIHGSFFFGGGDDAGYQPSLRLIRHLESEASRLDGLFPLLALALCEGSAPVDELAATAAAIGLPADSRWSHRAVEAGLAAPAESPWGPGVAIDPVAFRYGLSFLVTGAAASGVRHQLGQLLAARSSAGEPSWHAYRLLAGTPEALPPLLSAAASSQTAAIPREDLLVTLTNELRLAQQRGAGRRVELQLLWRLLPLARRLGRLAGYRDELARALELSASQPDQLLAIAGLKAEIEHEAGESAEAEATIRGALRTAQGSDIQRQALLLIQLGKILVRQGRGEEASAIFRNLLSVLSQGDNAALEASCRFFLGNIALRDGMMEEAAEHHKASLVIRQERQLHRPAGSSMSALGAVAVARGNYPEALVYYRRAQEILEQHGQADQVSFALLGVGRALSRLGDFAGASKPLRRALELREGRDDQAGEAIARLAVAANYLALGQEERALTEARQAHFQLSMSSQEEALGEAEQLLGRILLRQRKHDQAQRHLEAAVDIHRRYAEDLELGFDQSALLSLAIATESGKLVSHQVADLKETVDRLKLVDLGELLHFRLYQGLSWLSRNGHKVGDPTPSLERAYRQLLAKARHLEPSQRNRFLFQIPINQEIVEAATRQGLTNPLTESA